MIQPVRIVRTEINYLCKENILKNEHWTIYQNYRSEKY